MNLRAYLYTVNKNRGFILNPDEIKDVLQDTEVYLLQKDYNDQNTRYAVLAYYQRAIQKKVNQKKFIEEQQDTRIPEEDTAEQEVQEKRERLIKYLEISPVQKKIVKLLVEGFCYEEIRKKLKLSQRQLIDHCKMIKKKNKV